MPLSSHSSSDKDKTTMIIQIRIEENYGIIVTLALILFIDLQLSFFFVMHLLMRITNQVID